MPPELTSAALRAKERIVAQVKNDDRFEGIGIGMFGGKVAVTVDRSGGKKFDLASEIDGVRIRQRVTGRAVAM
jgi:hypothetical protein